MNPVIANEKRHQKELRAKELLQALASGKPNMAAYESLWLAARMWLRTGGGLPMERFAGLPTTGPALMQANRDLWLRRAALVLPDPPGFPLASRLTHELERFITRGPWRAWMAADHPPPEASELRKALFFAAKFNGGCVLSERQIYRVLS